MSRKNLLIAIPVIAAVIVIALIAFNASPRPAADPTPAVVTVQPTATNTSTAEPTATATVTPSETPKPTATIETIATSTSTLTPSPTRPAVIQSPTQAPVRPTDIPKPTPIVVENKPIVEADGEVRPAFIPKDNCAYLGNKYWSCSLREDIRIRNEGDPKFQLNPKFVYYRDYKADANNPAGTYYDFDFSETKLVKVIIWTVK